MTYKKKKTLNTQNSHSPKDTPKNKGGFIGVDFQTASEIDYLSKLTKEQREFYERFLENDLNAMYHKDGKDVIQPGTEEARRSNRDKQRRLKDIYNNTYEKELPNGSKILIPKDKTKREPKKRFPKSKVTKPLQFKTTETIEEFLARGGKITKVPKVKP